MMFEFCIQNTLTYRNKYTQHTKLKYAVDWFVGYTGTYSLESKMPREPAVCPVLNGSTTTWIVLSV